MKDDEDFDFVASEHDRMVSAITKLDKTQHITEPTRSEPTSLNSEFNLIKKPNVLKLKNVVKVLEDTAHNVQISKKLKESQKVSRVLPKPLEKPQAERIKRATGYEQTKNKVARWDPVVARNRTVDFVSYPLKTFSSKMQPTGDFLSKLKLKSSLEKELEEIDPAPEPEVIEEEKQTYPMSYQEMLEHRQHLAKIRAQQSYNAAKAKRQSKIKSKKYHRILKKEKLKQQIKEFEELQTKNPEEALKKLEELEKVRALERHTLRHKNTGKWAKSKLVRAKYDKEVRQQLSEQLSVSKSLTKKVQNTESTDDEADETENIPDITLAQDEKNPWMMKRSDKTNIDAEFNFGYKKYLKDKMYKRKEESDSDSDEENSKHDKLSLSLRVLKEGLKKLGNSDNSVNTDMVTEKQEDDNNSNLVKNQNISFNKTKSSVETITKQRKNKSNKTIATSPWHVDTIDATTVNKQDKIVSENETVSEAFDNLDKKIAIRVGKKLMKLKKEMKKLERAPISGDSNSNKESDEIDNLEYLKLRKQNPKPFIDEELIETHGNKKIMDKETTNIPLNILSKTDKPLEEHTNADIDPSRFIEVKPKYLSTSKSNEDNDFDDLDDDEQVVPKVDIEEVFEEDDVVASFRQEKEDEINNDTPKNVDLTLPGWGQWGGKGVKTKPSKRKNNRFIKAPPKVPRRDENKGDIIINEIKIPKLVSHKVADIPFPFTSVKEYEASIRTPMGNTFIPETAHKKLIRPNVITKVGSVIEPMDEDELLVKRNQTFKNESVIKLLGKQ
ncbi:U3 small nucleolar RNA-associated protein 14 homolog A [Vanessa tameamea]|uniref:U3 small nucleolar RNA-associated protein 14 homolog A n=1 Tax=Vanessa tameamea TaxID=334116 RepID=A0A8B8IG19_VANTA|nr:U3 small nucleolar RNA-associated protein 14 homolog A [Vanessa tameamea]